MSPPLLSVDGVSKRFGNFQALDRIDLDIQQGEFVALLGPSGCGKTTLLRTLAGFLQPDTGKVFIDGTDVSRLPPHKRPLNTVFQNYALFPHMTVMENVCYGPLRRGLRKPEASEQSNAALTMVGMESFSHRYPRQLSGGQQQRVALARAIVNQPKLLLLDEPLSALDLKLRKRMQLELKQLQNQLGIAFVFVTHDQEEALTMADRVVVMNAGNIEQAGPGDHIYRHPESHFVANFIGEANLLSCRIAQPGLLEFSIGGRRIQVPDSFASGEYTAVVRPEHFWLEPRSQPGQGDRPRFDAVVSDVVKMGSHQMVYVKAQDQALVVRCTDLQPDWIAPGLPVALALATSDVHLIKGAP